MTSSLMTWATLLLRHEWVVVVVVGQSCFGLTISTSWVRRRSTSSLEMSRQSDYVGTAVDQTISY